MLHQITFDLQNVILHLSRRISFNAIYYMVLGLPKTGSSLTFLPGRNSIIFFYQVLVGNWADTTNFWSNTCKIVNYPTKCLNPKATLLHSSRKEIYCLVFQQNCKFKLPITVGVMLILVEVSSHYFYDVHKMVDSANFNIGSSTYWNLCQLKIDRNVHLGK